MIAVTALTLFGGFAISLLAVVAAALQFVRKLSGSNKPSKANEAAFTKALIQE